MGMAERRAKQSADLEVAQMALQTAKAEAEMRQLQGSITLEIARLEADAKRLAGEVEAENAAKLAAARYSFLDGDAARLQAFQAEQMVQMMPHMAQPQMVRHCLDMGATPDAAQLMPLLMMQQMSPARPGAAQQGSTDVSAMQSMLVASMLGGMGGGAGGSSQARTP